MKKFAPEIIGVGCFLLLVGIGSWVAWEQVKGGRPAAGNESQAEREAEIQTAFVGGETSEAKPVEINGVEVDPALRQEVENFFQELGTAYETGDADQIGALFSVDAMVKSSEGRGLVNFGVGKKRRDMMRGFEMGMKQGFSRWAEVMSWDDIKIVRIKEIKDGELIAYGQFWDEELETVSKMRWWLIRQEDLWKAYDYEDLDTGIRVTALLGPLMAAGASGQPWMKELPAAMATVQALYNDVLTGYADTTEMEERFRKLLDYSLPSEIESLSKLMLAAALIVQERFEEALEVMDPAEFGAEPSPLLYHQRGTCLGGLERYDEALQEYETYSRILGWDSSLREMTADLYLAKGDRETALEHSKLGLDENSRSLGCFATMVCSMSEEGWSEVDAYAEATGQLEEAWEITIDYALTLDQRGTAELAFARLKAAFPESDLIDYYQETDDLGSGIMVTEWQFEDWLEDESVQKALDEKYQRRQAFVEHLGELKPEQITLAVAQLRQAEKAALANQILAAQRDGAKTALLDALKDERFRIPYSAVEPDEEGYRRSPFPVNHLLDLLAALEAPQGNEALATLLTHEDAQVRGAAGRLAGITGQVAEWERIQTGMKDSDRSVRGQTRFGLIQAFRAERASPELIEKAVEELEFQLGDPTEGNEPDGIAWALLTLDRERGAKFLRRPEILRTDHPHLSLVLEGLNQFEIPVARERLLTILESYHPRLSEETTDQVFAAALVNLSRQDGAKFEVGVWANKVLDHPSKSVRDAGANALGEAEGMWEIDWYEVQSQTESGRVISILECSDLVAWIDSEVGYEGFEYFFGELYDTNIKDFFAALEQIGARQSVDLLRQAVGKFGPGGFPDDEEALWERLTEIVEKDPEVFTSLDEAWARDPDHLEVIRLQFLYDNQELLMATARHLELVPEKGEPAETSE